MNETKTIKSELSPLTSIDLLAVFLHTRKFFMKTIYKYNLEVTDVQQVQLPKEAKILCVQTQHGEPHLWAEVDTDKTPEARTIEIFGTGHPISQEMGQNRRYISTFQLQGGLLVFHAYEYTGV